MPDDRFPDGTRIVVEEQPGGTTDLLLELDGKRVSRVVIIPMLMRLGAAAVRMDGIGGVETEAVYRQRGYSRRLMAAAVARIRAGDAALSTLFGIQDFYQKFGYETAGPEYTICQPLADQQELPALPAGWRCRPFAAEDLPAVQRLYHLNTHRATGALLRHDSGNESAATAHLAAASPVARRIGRRAWGKLSQVANGEAADACRVLIDPAGEVAGYAWQGARNWWMGVRQQELPRAFHFAEVMAQDPTAADALLAACCRWAREPGGDWEEVAMAMPPAGAVAAAAAYQGGRALAVYTRGGDFMGRVLDLDRLLRQMLPELSARVRAARLPSAIRLQLVTEEAEATLAISDGDITIASNGGAARLVVELPQAILARLSLGGFDPADVIARLPSRPPAEVATLLGVLFPRRAPFIYPLDRF